MKIGGYQIIDLEKIQLIKTNGVQNPTTFKGIYNKINSTNKVCLISGFSAYGRTFNDCFSTPTLEGSNLVFYADIYYTTSSLGTVKFKISITPGDVVSASTVVVIAPTTAQG